MRGRRAFRGPGARPLRFLLAGGINTAVGLSFYPALLWAVPWLRVHYLAALGIAQAVCLVFAFCVHKFAVFRTRGGVLHEFAAFAGFYLFNYAANWAALPLLVEVGKVPPVIAQLAFNAVLIVGSWFWHSRVTFRDGEGGLGREGC
jgi:putative flippase GtrA